MGEVRVRVKLTNAVDQALVRRGLLRPEQVRTYEADALVDTRAVRCVLPPHVVQRLGLEMVAQRVAEYADGRLEAVGLTEAFTLGPEPGTSRSACIKSQIVALRKHHARCTHPC